MLKLSDLVINKDSEKKNNHLPVRYEWFNTVCLHQGKLHLAFEMPQTRHETRHNTEKKV